MTDRSTDRPSSVRRPPCPKTPLVQEAILSGRCDKERASFALLRGKQRGTYGQGYLDPWIHGSMDPWIHGSMDPWIHGCVDPWFMDPWFMDPWTHGSMEFDKILKVREMGSNRGRQDAGIVHSAHIFALFVPRTTYVFAP